MPGPLSYADAVRLLGGQQSKAVNALDKLTGGALLAGAVATSALVPPVAPLLIGLFDAKAEFVRLSHELVREFTERRNGLSRHSRTQRLEAAHQVLVVTAYFEALAQANLPFRFADLALTEAEVSALLRRTRAPGRSLLDLLLDGPVPSTIPHQTYETFTAELKTCYGELSIRLREFVSLLAVWDQLSDRERSQAAAVLAALPDAAIARHRELLGKLGTDFPEVAFWIGLAEHQGTRDEVRALADSLAGMQRLLERISTGQAPDARRDSLARAYTAALHRPIVQSGDVPAGLSVPTLGEAYRPPLCRVAELGAADRPSDEFWWGGQLVRDDLPEFLIGYLTSPGAVHAPLLVLGQPGSGKSVLTKVLAARLPPADFLPVRVVLRDVPAAADLQEQIEYAIRDATGERLEWPALVRSAGDALPVMLLDGFDELLQATGVSQTDYLRRVSAFQRREADQGRPVIVIVTSRTSVADRAQAPEGTVAVRLEPFDEERITGWLATWNEVNAANFAARGVAPLDPATVLAHHELAEQPLLLLMLALYDADGNALREAGDLRRDELYERLLRRFARREVVKHRPGLPEGELDRAVEEELRRLSVVAFAMFNRAAQWVTEADLEADLAALVGVPGKGSGNTDLRAPLRPAEVVLGRFFFVHRAQASRDGDKLETYEFLHATFGEFLVARLTWRVLAGMVARESAGADLGLGLAGPVDDDLLRTLLSYAVLSGRASILGFLRALLTRPGMDSGACRDLLLRLLRFVHHTPPPRRFEEYRPRPAGVPATYAAYSANLLLLAVCAAGTVRGTEIYGADADVVAQWHAQAMLWRSQLSAEDWPSLVDALALDRIGEGDQRDVTLRLDDGDFTPPPIDIYWTYRLRREPEEMEGQRIAYLWPNQDSTQLRRRAHFECGVNADMILHALEPLTERLPVSVNMTFGWWTVASPSAAHLLLALSLPPQRMGPPEKRQGLYHRCAELVSSPWEEPWAEAVEVIAELLLDRLASDPDMPASVGASILGQLADGGRRLGPTYLTTSLLRYALVFLGRDAAIDRRISGDILVPLLMSKRWTADGDSWAGNEVAVEAAVRLNELGLERLRFQPEEYTEVAVRLGRRRPDLVARVRQLVDHPNLPKYGRPPPQ